MKKCIATVSAALAATVLSAQTTFGPPLVITNINAQANGGNEFLLQLSDYRNIVGFQVFGKTNLTDLVWSPLNSADANGGLFLTGKTDEWDFGQPYASIYKSSGYQFFKTYAVKGPARAEIITVITAGSDGSVTNYYVEVETGVYIETDAGGKPKIPVSYWTGVPSGPTRVYPDGKGGWTNEVVCLCACPGCTCNLPSYPVDNSITWDKVDHTLRIDLADYTATKLPANYDVRFDGDNGKTNYLYFRYIVPGFFTMGSPHLGYNGATETEFHRESARETQTVATFNSGFYIGVYELTVAQYNRIMKNAGSYTDANPRRTLSWNLVRGGSNGASLSPLAAPVAGTVLWNLQYGVTNNPANNWLSNFTVDLPTEAQWEYSCRAGMTGTFYDSNEIMVHALDVTVSNRLNAIAWWGYTAGNSGGVWHEVGLKNGNDAGLYDMHGNVRETCRDTFDDSDIVLFDIAGGGISMIDRLRTTGTNSVIRGGDYGDPVASQRDAFRGYLPLFTGSSNQGIRLGASTGGRKIDGGDGSQWMEIATHGGYSLFVRVNRLPAPFSPSQFDASGSNNYIGSTAKDQVDSWWNSLGNCKVKQQAAKHNAWSSLGFCHWDGADQIGFSAPIADGNNTSGAFLLSYQEAAKYCSRYWYEASGALHDSSGQAYRNWQSLGSEGTVETWWLRSPHSNGSYVSTVSISGDMSTRPVADPLPLALRPAVWLPTSIR